MTLPTGQPITAKAGDWLITRGQQVVDVVAALEPTYEPLSAAMLEIDVAVAQRLERTLGLGAAHSPFTLVEAVERLASISIGTVHVDFTPGQLDEIKHRAGKRGHTVEQELRAVVDRIKDEIFHRG